MGCLSYLRRLDLHGRLGIKEGTMNQSSPKFSREAEDCSSSESGWTMYLASSSMHGDTSNGDDDDEVGSGTISVQSSGEDEAKEEDDDDDSMASDASSGTPCKQCWHDDVGGVVKEKKKKSSQCSSRCSRKNHKVETGDVSKEEGNGDSIFIHGGSKMRRVKFGEK
ncbi:uncharacterized protein LOC110031744 isoform X1 [Phalaenopsis equestris]|uniref:uncharacterized protein LOC110031744 isoform X1 n=2 Tax=Phalaenopsis equestris TaxID=78828 RepID=UPI0009E414C8|nr:uncharacterized protein LOC110031744 isoform X1 [Phalaenopsis equestris]